ncbi:unnamed protein product, partial [Phaeothamnion confervicola]
MIPNSGAYRTYSASSPITWAFAGRKTVTLCVDQGPFLKIGALSFFVGGPSMLPYPLSIPGTINGADYSTTGVQTYSGPCGPRYGTKLWEVFSGEQYTFDLLAKRTGSYAVTYSIAAGNDAGVPISLYLVSGNDCGADRHNWLQLDNVYTGGYDSFADFVVTEAPLDIT